MTDSQTQARTRISFLLNDTQVGQTVRVCGWVRTFRNDRFLAVNDGSTLNNLQLVVDKGATTPEVLKQLHTGAAVEAVGELVESQGGGQATELKVATLTVLGGADPEEFPIQMKRHSLDFLREKAHLRFRTNTFAAVFRVRHALQFAVHSFFHERGFYQLHTPIITGSDAEGAGEMFRVTTLDLDNVPKNDQGNVDVEKDFFGKESNLTVSGQLEAETYATALGRVYTFGPTFRAENSNTSRHLAEFWMVEPEAAFFDLQDNMQLAERFLKRVFSDCLEHCSEDVEFFDQRIEKGKVQQLQSVIEKPFTHLSYTKAIEILTSCNESFEYPVSWGTDLQAEHERYLTEKYVQGPVILTDYPSCIKPFYMRLSDDEKTVAAMDVLVPGVGEIIGGSQREERLEVLQKRMSESDLDEKEYWWYLDLRRYGSVPHAGFGLGLERAVQYATGMANIRDVVPFPRTPGNAEF